MVFDNYKFRSPVSLHNPVQEKHPIKNPRMYLEDLESNVPNSMYYADKMTDNLTKGVGGALLYGAGKYLKGHSNGFPMKALSMGMKGIGALGAASGALGAANSFAKSRNWRKQEEAIKTSSASVQYKLNAFLNKTASMNTYNKLEAFLQKTAAYKKNKYASIARTATNVGKNIGKTLGETLKSSKGPLAAGALGGAGLMGMHNQYHNN